MAQADGNIANQTFPATRTDLNNQYLALFTTHSGGTAPSTPYETQFWADNSTGLLKIRTQANDAWVPIGSLDENGLLRNNAGNPNGVLTGNFSREILYDTVNNVIWTYSGSGTVWYNALGGTSSSASKSVTNITNADSPYSALTSNDIINCNAISGAITVTLYTAVGNAGKELTITKTDSSANAVTIDGNGAETISGKLTHLLYTQNDTITIYSNGSNWIIKSPIRSRVLLSTQTVSVAVASVDFTDFIDGNYSLYEIECVDVQPSTNQVYLYSRISVDGGSNWKTAASDYYNNGIQGNNSQYSNQEAQMNLSRDWIGVGERLSNTSTKKLHGKLQLHTPGNTTNYKTISYETRWTINSSVYPGRMYGEVVVNITGAYNAIQFFMSSGNIATGTFRLYGVNY